MSESPESAAFLSVVPAAFGETRLPLTYRVLQSAEGGTVGVNRSAPSEPYRATRFACQPFHRPVTKPLRAP